MTTIDIDSARTNDAVQLAAAFIERGVAAQVVGAGRRVRLATTEAAATVERIVEGWLAERQLPLVPEHISEHSIVLRPPAG